MKFLAKRVNKTFMGFLISYVLLLVLFVFAELIAYSQVRTILVSETTKANTGFIQNAISSIDNSFKEINNVVVQLGMDYNIVNFSKYSGLLRDPQYYDLMLMLKNTSTLKYSNELVAGIDIFFANSNTLLTNGAAITENSKVNNDSLMQFWENLTTSQSYKKTSFHVNQGKIFYVKNININITEKSRGLVGIIINKAVLLSHFTGIDLGENGWCYIAENTGKIIAGVNIDQIKERIEDAEYNVTTKEMTIQGANYIISSKKSSYNDLVYVIAVPTSLFMSKVQHLRNIYIILLSTILFLGGLFSILFSYRNNLPLKKIAKQLMLNGKTDDLASNDLYQSINHSMSIIIGEYKDLQDDLNKQAPILKQGIFYRLYKGDFISENQLQDLLSYIGEDIQSDLYFVALVNINCNQDDFSAEALRDMTIRRITIEKLLIDRFSNKISLSNERNDLVIALFSNSDFEFLQSGLENFRAELQPRYALTVQIGISNSFKPLTDAHIAYREASHAVDYAISNQLAAVVAYRDLKSIKNVYNYPLDMENKLICTIKAGSYDDVQKILNELKQSNFDKFDLSTVEQWLLIDEFKGTVYKTVRELALSTSKDFEKLNELIQQTSHDDSPVKAFTTMSRAFIFLCQIVFERNSNYSNVLKGKITQYINDHYIDMDFGLKTIARQFDFTENYFSTLFHRLTGENFSSYTRNLRIKKSILLLVETELSIADIAHKIGYTQENSFYRAFREFMHLSPDDFRKQERTMRLYKD